MDQGAGIVDLDDQFPGRDRQHRAVEGEGRLTTDGGSEILTKVEADDLLNDLKLLYGLLVLGCRKTKKIVKHICCVLGDGGGRDVGVW